MFRSGDSFGLWSETGLSIAARKGVSGCTDIPMDAGWWFTTITAETRYQSALSSKS